MQTAARNREKGFNLPDMAPFAGLIFLLVCFYLLTNQFRQPETSNVQTENLPFSKTHACIPENNEAVISLTDKNRLAFAVNSRKAQALTIQKVAQRHRIFFTSKQLHELEDIPYLATNVENLPIFLALPSYQRNRTVQKQLLPPLSEQQLIECIASAKSAVQTLYHKPVYMSLRIGAEVKDGKVNHLLDLLETNGYHRFNLHTQY